MLPVFLDIEASGFGKGSYPIEVGFILPDSKTYCTIIRRQPDWTHWDEQAEQLHGISREALNEYGSDVVDVAKNLNYWLHGQVVYSDAWGNDCSWLALLFECAGISQQFRLETLRRLLTEAQAELWHTVKDQVIAGAESGRHRASTDAKILQQTYQAVIAHSGHHS